MTHNKDNPFLTGNTIQEQANNANWESQSSQPDLSKKIGGWNPFEDTVNFGAISEDMLFGEHDQNVFIHNRVFFKQNKQFIFYQVQNLIG